MAGSEYNLTFGIKADAKQAKKEIKDIVVQAQSIAKDIQAALEATKGSRKGTQLRQLRDEMNVTSKEVKQASDAFSLYQAVLGQTAAAEKRLSDVRNDKDRKNLKKSLSRYTVKRNNLDANDPGSAAKLEKYNTKIAEIESKLKPSNDKIEKLTSKITNLKARTAELKPLAKAFVDEYGKAGATAREILDIVNKTATSTGDLSGKANQINDGFDKAKTSANGAKDALAGLTSKENKANEAKAKTATATAKEDTSIKGLLDTLSKYQAQLVRTQRAGQDTADIEEKIATTTEKLNDKFKFSSASKNITDVTRRLLEMQQAKRELESAGIPKQFAGQYTQIVAEIERLKQSISDYKKSLHGTRVAHETTAKSSKKMLDGLKKLPSIIGTLKSGFKSLSKTLNRIRSSFDGMSRNMRSNFKHMLTSITKYVLGFRSLFFLVRRLRKYIGEGIQNMAQFNDGNNHVNESITRLLSSLLYLKNAWATAFSPILQFVTPWLERLIDGVARAGNAVSRFIGSLLGQENVFQAVKVDAASYADNLDKAAGSAGNAADKTKKLTDRLAAFDDLNVLGIDRDPDATGSGGGGGSADTYAPDPNEMFEIVNVGREVLDKLKEMWANADFSELGKTLKYKLLGALLDVQQNLDDFKDTAYNIGKSIITFFNGVLGDKTLWTEAGKTLGKTVNVVSAFVSGLLENNEVDWGGGLASLINGFFASTDWEQIHNNIINFVTQFKDNVISFLTTLNWDGEGGIFSAVQSLGTAIGQALNETLGDAEFMSSLGDALGKLVSAILITWKAILDQNDGDEIGNALYEFFASLINAINWDTLAENLSGSLVLLLNAISTFSENLSEDDSFQQALSDFVENLDLDTIFEALGRNISSSTAAANAVGSALASTLASQDVADKFTTGLTALIGNIDINEMVSTTTEFLGNLLGSALADPTLPIKLAGAIVVGIGNALGDALIGVAENSDIENWWEHPAWAIVEGLAKGIHDLLDLDWASDAFANLLTSFCDFLGIHSPSTVFEEYGKNIIEGLLNGINSLVDTVMDPFTTLGNDLATKWDEIKGNAYEKWVGIKTNVLTKAGEIKDQAEEKFETLKTNLTNKWQEIKGNIYEKLVGIKTNMKEVFEQMGDAIKAPINTIIDIIEGMVNKAIDGINSLTSGLSALTDLGSEIANKIGMPSIPHLSQLPHITIPHLAQGAVIPPNREFMAVLGDQSNGTNIEAPLDTIKQAVAEVMANNGNAEMIQLLQQLITVVENKNLVIGDKEIGRANARYVKQQNIVRGATF